jgi:L-seryl-tRNA(Ser) seleniumtransferase
MDPRRDLPSVDRVLQMEELLSLQQEYGHALTVKAVQEVLADLRSGTVQGSKSQPKMVDLVAQKLEEWAHSTLLPVINATGVILHTNLGRAPLSGAAISAIEQAGANYSTLEFDLAGGKRGSRSVHAADLLKRATGAEDALVVNNNAAAVLLVLSVLAKRKKAVISRTQLVEIGGGFRIPEVMAQSGAKLIEIGTTNRVHLQDYQEALEQGAQVVLRAHHSNFKIIGFTAEPELPEIIRLAHSHGAVFIDDLGSGALLDTARFGLSHEPMVQESISSGADLVCFSGDKLLGGPQAGIIVGRSDLLAKIKKAPLARALRADKLCLAALSATLMHYLKGEAESQIPVWKMITTPLEDVEKRATQLRERLGRGNVKTGVSTIGGGSLPEETLPTMLLQLDVERADVFARKLRLSDPPVITRIEQDKVILDLRTVMPGQEEALAEAVQRAFA